MAARGKESQMSIAWDSEAEEENHGDRGHRSRRRLSSLQSQTSALRKQSERCLPVSMARARRYEEQADGSMRRIANEPIKSTKTKRRMSKRRAALGAVRGDHENVWSRRFRQLFAWIMEKLQLIFGLEDDYEGNQDDEEDAAFRHRINPPPLQSLVDRTGFDKDWLQYMYREFKQKCPSGKMNDVDFLSIFRVLFPNSVGDSFARRMFLAFDRGSQDMITFEDVILTIWELNQRTPEMHSDFVMQLIDPHFYGKVDYNCYEQYIQSVLSLQGNSAAFNEYKARHIAKLSFMELDSQQSGKFNVGDLERLFGSLNRILMIEELNKGYGTASRNLNQPIRESLSAADQDLSSQCLDSISIDGTILEFEHKMNDEIL